MKFTRKATVPKTSVDGDTLAHIDDILDRIGAEAGRLEKIALIQRSADVPYFKDVVLAALDPYRMYKVTSCSPYSQMISEPTTDMGTYRERSVKNIFAKLNDLADAKGATALDRNELSWLAAIDKETVKVVNRILKKDLRCGAGAKTFAQVFPELNTSSPMLCDHNFSTFKVLCHDDPAQCLVSTKLDGVRTWAVMRGHNIVYVSRNGHYYENFDVFDVELRRLEARVKAMNPFIKSITFDGEAIGKDRDFDAFAGNARKQTNADTSQFMYNIFDIVINDNTDPLPLYKRLEILEKAFADREWERVAILEHKPLDTWDNVETLLRERLRDGEEGLILKLRDGRYMFKRSKEWCKVKRRDAGHDTLDLVVVGMQEGTGALEGKLGALICEYNGTQVKVGSGYTVAQREEFFKNPPKMIEVDYQEITKSGSLRFPAFVRDRTLDKYEQE